MTGPLYGADVALGVELTVKTGAENGWVGTSIRGPRR